MKFDRHLLLIIAITLLGFLIRVYKIDSSPAGLYIDETSIGYNAYSLITTGHDEHGKFMPLFFEAFGEYKLPVYIYSVALTQLLIGANDLSVRLPAVFFGILTIPFVFLLSKELLKNSNDRLKATVPYLCAFLLATSPWHFQFSRPGFEASIGLFFLTLGLFSFFRSVRKNSTVILGISIISFVMSLYSYNSARIVTPTILLTLTIFYFKNFPLATWLKILSIGIFLALPVIFFAVSPEGLIRTKQVSIFYQPSSEPVLNQFLMNYWSNISPFYLFVKGDPTIAHLTPYRMSLLYLVELPLFFIGLLMLFIKRSKEYFFILILLLVAFIPPAMTTLNPHALRAFLALPATTFISALGFGYFLTVFQKTYVKNFLVGLYLVTLGILTYRFLDIYHNKYAINAGWDWQVGIKKASLRVLEVENNYSDIYFDLDPRLIPVVWYLKIYSGLYQESINKNHLGKFHINENVSSAHGLYVGLQPPPKGELLEYIYYPNNSVAYGIWEI